MPNPPEPGPQNPGTPMVGAPAAAPSDSRETGRLETWKGLAWIVAIVGIWLVLQRYVLPAMGCKT